MSCLLCRSTGTTTKYVGETSRSAYIRCKEHMALYRRSAYNSVLYNHQHEHHRGQELSFKVEVEATFPDDTLGRQVNEAIRIWQGEAQGTTLNDRTEWNHPGLVRAALERQ